MLQYLKNEANIAHTENGAVSNASTLSGCLDLCATVGALRHAAEEEIITRFLRSFAENPDLALKTAFFARDIRGGLGERRVFRTIIMWLAKYHPESIRRNIPFVAEFGRYDDLLCLLGTPVQEEALDTIRTQFERDMSNLEKGGTVSLLGKWLPSVNASSAETRRQAKIVARALGLRDDAYRKALSALRGKICIIENNLREKDYSFDYARQPSRAMFKYRKAFLRNDNERYTAFLSAVEKGEANLHADTLMPYELVEPFLDGRNYTRDNKSFLRELDGAEQAAINATWKALPDFAGEENALAVVDTSGSMYWQAKPLPAAVALSLGLYFAERSRGAFRGHFIEFSRTPRLIEIKGDSFADRLRYIASFNEVANTNLEAVFELILRTAVKHRVPQSELPATLYIISDMEFDACIEGGGVTNFENAKARFAQHGYALPQVVFWNVASRNRQQPVTMNEQGAALISGCSPRIFRMLSAGVLTPCAFMMETLMGNRYACIGA